MLCLSGLVTNSLSFCIFHADRKRHKERRVLGAGVFLLKVLAVFDNIYLVVAFCTNVIWHGLMPAMDHYHGVGGKVYGASWPYLITVVHPSELLIRSMVIWTTVLIAFNRYMGLCHNFGRMGLITSKLCSFFGTKVQVSVMCIILLLYFGPTYFQWWIINEVRYNNATGQNKTEYYGRTLIDPPTLEFYHTKIFSTIIIQILPLALLIGMNAGILCALRDSRPFQESATGQRGPNANEKIATRNMIMVTMFFLLF